MQSYIKHHKTMYIFGSILDRWYPQNSFGQIEMWFQSLERGTVPIHHIYPYRYVYTVLIYIYIYPHIYIYKSGTNQLQSSDHFRWNSSKYLSSRPFSSRRMPWPQPWTPCAWPSRFLLAGWQMFSLDASCCWSDVGQRFPNHWGVVWWWNPIGFTGESSFFPL